MPDALASVIKGEQADIMRLRKRQTAKRLANTLSMFESRAARAMTGMWMSAT